MWGEAKQPCNVQFPFSIFVLVCLCIFQEAKQQTGF